MIRKLYVSLRVCSCSQPFVGRGRSETEEDKEENTKGQEEEVQGHKGTELIAGHPILAWCNGVGVHRRELHQPQKVL